MNEKLLHFMAEVESWESATEFGIPDDLWAGYLVRQRSDDLYIAVLSSVFDNLREEDSKIKLERLSELAKTLLIYSRSTASQYITGVDKTITLLYCAAIFYLAEFPATATFLARKINVSNGISTEEMFLHSMLSREINDNDELGSQFINELGSPEENNFDLLISHYKEKSKEGLQNDPKLFIASRLILKSLERFKNVNIWDCLRVNAANFNYDLWKPFLINSKAFPIWELFPSQMAAIETGILSDTNKVYSMQMPTSSGKTSLCEILIYNEVKGRGKKVLFLVPFRALASEIKEGISKRLESTGVTVVASHGGNIPTRSESATAETADVLIVTPEKFTALVQSLPDLESSFETVICDEGHLIDDSSRGLQYELLLTKLKFSEINSRKIVFISAILPNVDDIHKWLGGTPDTLSKSEYKPVETDYAFIKPHGADSWQLDFNTIYERPRSYFLSKFIIKDDLKYINPNSGRLNLISGYSNYTSLACAAAIKARRNGSVALFTTQKNYIASLAKKMIELYHLEAIITRDRFTLSTHLPELIEYIAFQFSEEYSLSKLLQYGIGFHHGDMPQEIRREMESAIQKETVDILLCTSTLAEGVNLPIRTLVIHTIKRFDGQANSPIENRSLKNIIGRVGRAGKETRGRIIFANDNERHNVENVFNEISMEPASGALFKLISNINEALSALEIQLSNEIFEAQSPDFLSILDNIDIALLDLIPPEIIFEDIENHVANLIEQTLAYQYCDTAELKNRIKEVFNIRTTYLQDVVPRDSWSLLKRSGASPRYWKYVNDLSLIEQSEWQSLDTPYDEKWIDEIVLKIIELPTLQIEDDNLLIRSAIIFWMSGLTYGEIANHCDVEIDTILKLLGNTIGYKLQDGLATLTQLAITHYGEDKLSELARNWSSLLQYGLGNLQQLDLFTRGASDRLAVWGISRYLQENNLDYRGIDLMKYLRRDAKNLISFLENDSRVPRLSSKRICDELKITSF